MFHPPKLHSPLGIPSLFLFFSLPFSDYLQVPPFTSPPPTLTHTLCTPFVCCACMFYNVFVVSLSGLMVFHYVIYRDHDLFISLSNIHTSSIQHFRHHHPNTHCSQTATHTLQTATDSSHRHTQKLYYMDSYSMTEHLLSPCLS